MRSCNRAPATCSWLEHPQRVLLIEHPRCVFCWCTRRANERWKLYSAELFAVFIPKLFPELFPEVDLELISAFFAMTNVKTKIRV